MAYECASPCAEKQFLLVGTPVVHKSGTRACMTAQADKLCMMMRTRTVFR